MFCVCILGEMALERWLVLLSPAGFVGPPFAPALVTVGYC